VDDVLKTSLLGNFGCIFFSIDKIQVPIHFGLLCDMREELSDTKWQDCDPQSWSLWYHAKHIVSLFMFHIMRTSGGLLLLQSRWRNSIFSAYLLILILPLMSFLRHRWGHSQGNNLLSLLQVIVLGGINTCNLPCMTFEYKSADVVFRYVCCAAELKRCEAKVLALQCSVDDLVILSVPCIIFCFSRFFASRMGSMQSTAN
jgi:hypothetical protein